MNIRDNMNIRGTENTLGGNYGYRGGGGGGGGGDYRGGGGGDSYRGGGDSYISYANLLKENFEGTSLDNLQSKSTDNKSNDNVSLSKRVSKQRVENSTDEDNDELVDLIKDNVISNEIIKKNKKGIKKIEKEAKSIFNINYKEFALLFFIYFLLSQEMIKDGFALYFTSLNPDNSGRIGVKGVIIYGLLLTTIFMVSKYYLL